MAEESNKVTPSDGAENVLLSLKPYCPTTEFAQAGFKVRRTKVINILLVGRSQSGKSTLMETLINPQQAVKGKGFAVTKVPEVKSFVLTDEKNDISYTVNVLDTPGLHEICLDDKLDRDDNEIIQLAMRFISKQITFLNVIIYVSKGGNTHKDDVEVFDAVKDFLGENFSSNSLLLLTHCEEMSKIRISETFADLMKHPPAKRMLDYCKLGMLPYGTISGDALDLIDEQEDDPKLAEEVKASKVRVQLLRIEQMRKKLLEVIIRTAEKRCPISALQAIEKETEAKQRELIQAALNKEKSQWENVRQKRLEHDEMLYMQRLNEEYEKYINEEEDRLQAEMEAKLHKHLEKIRGESDLRLKLETQLLIDKHNEEISKFKETEKLDRTKMDELKKKEALSKRNAEYQETLRKQLQESEQRYREELTQKMDEEMSQLRAQQEALKQRRFEEMKHARRRGRKDCVIM